MTATTLIKRHFPGVHARLVPFYWSGVRPAMLPLLQYQLSRALDEAATRAEWHALNDRLRGRVSHRLSPRDRYAGVSRGLARHYVRVGYTALRCIRAALDRLGRRDPESVLDFPCGHGRVLRFLTAAFPTARITACDLDRGMVDFCSDAFGARGVYSKDSPSDLVLPDAFDLIWCGSLLTHLGPERWHGFLDLFHHHLRPGGLLVFTTHGERVAERMRARVDDYGLSGTGLHRVLDGYDAEGFGFSRYPSSPSYYGVSLVSRSRVLEEIGSFPDLVVADHFEHGWDDHQDVFACHRDPLELPDR